MKELQRRVDRVERLLQAVSLSEPALIVVASEHEKDEIAVRRVLGIGVLGQLRTGRMSAPVLIVRGISSEASAADLR